MMTEQPHNFEPLMGLLILYGIVIISVAAVLITALTRVKAEYGKTLRLVFNQIRFLELTTVLVIIISGTLLAIIGKVSPEGIIALYSGVAGYVLGGVAVPKGKTEQDDPPPKPSN